jgi:hypothetical protein
MDPGYDPSLNLRFWFLGSFFFTVGVFNTRLEHGDLPIFLDRCSAAVNVNPVPVRRSTLSRHLAKKVVAQSSTLIHPGPQVNSSVFTVLHMLKKIPLPRIRHQLDVYLVVTPDLGGTGFSLTAAQPWLMIATMKCPGTLCSPLTS